MIMTIYLPTCLLTYDNTQYEKLSYSIVFCEIPVKFDKIFSLWIQFQTMYRRVFVKLHKIFKIFNEFLEFYILFNSFLVYKRLKKEKQRCFLSYLFLRLPIPDI